MRFRIGTVSGNSQNSNETFVAIAKGSVIKSRSIVRVVAPSRWDKEALSQVVGISGNLSPRGVEDIGPSVEEHLDPHAHADEALGKGDDAGAETIDGYGSKKLDRQIRRFGFTPECPRCLDLETGAFRTDRRHNDDCRLRMRLAFREANNAQWRTVRHLVEPEPDAAFDRRNVAWKKLKITKFLGPSVARTYSTTPLDMRPRSRILPSDLKPQRWRGSTTTMVLVRNKWMRVTQSTSHLPITLWMPITKTT